LSLKLPRCSGTPAFRDGFVLYFLASLAGVSSRVRIIAHQAKHHAIAVQPLLAERLAGLNDARIEELIDDDADDAFSSAHRGSASHRNLRGINIDSL